MLRTGHTFWVRLHPVIHNRCRSSAVTFGGFWRSILWSHELCQYSRDQIEVGIPPGRVGACLEENVPATAAASLVASAILDIIRVVWAETESEGPSRFVSLCTAEGADFQNAPARKERTGDGEMGIWEGWEIQIAPLLT